MVVDFFPTGGAFDNLFDNLFVGRVYFKNIQITRRESRITKRTLQPSFDNESRFLFSRITKQLLMDRESWHASIPFLVLKARHPAIN